MTKRKYTFGSDYLRKCKLGIAMIRGERYYFISDGYARWLITDMDPETARFEVKLWTSGVNVSVAE